MEIVLLERVANLGQMGEVVKVRDGFARNFLLPRGMALRATKENIARFEAERAVIEARNLERKKEAEGAASKIDGVSVIALRSAGETGQLYGSVSSRDIAGLLAEQGVEVARSQIILDQPIKTLGLYTIKISLHGEVTATVTVNVARSQEEAERQARGEDIYASQIDEDDDADLDLEALFDDEAEVDPQEIEGADEDAPAEEEETKA